LSLVIKRGIILVGQNKIGGYEMKKSNKKNNNNNSKVNLMVGIVIIILLSISIILQVVNGNKEVAGTNSDASGNWQEALESNDLQLIYLGRPTCGWCNKIRPHLNYLSENYDMPFVYVNMDETTSSDQTTIFNKLNIDTNNFGTPYLAVVKDGKKIAEQVGFVEEEQLFKFLQDNNLISKSATYKASGITDQTEEETQVDDDSKYTNLTFVDYAAYKKIYEGFGKNILVIGRSGCSYCSKYKPVINEVAKEEGLKIYYLDIIKLTEDEWNTLFEKDLADFVKANQNWGTPSTIILEDQKVVDSFVGYTDKAATIKFYKKNGLIK
jgi:predicted bacteriocin transport accessory protein